MDDKMTYEMAKPFTPWNEGRAKIITFIVTEDCQLRCKYCYIIGKNNKHKMDFEIARQTVDYVLQEREIFDEVSVIWEFIGGEPFLEIELIDQISDYIKRKMYEENHPWFNNYRFSFSTNGILYGDPKVQRYIDKNKKHLSIGITIDGTRRKHDLQRTYPNGKGSYDDIIKSIPLWLEQFPAKSTKVTIAHDDLPYIKESVIHLWEIGITTVHINVVFEDCWEEGDDQIFEEQLRKLADYVIENDLYLDKNMTFFLESIGKPIDPSDNRNWCGRE